MKIVGKGYVCAAVVVIGAVLSVSGGAFAFEIGAGAGGGLSVASLIGGNALPGDGWDDRSLCVINGGAVAVVDFSRVFGAQLECRHSTKGIKAVQSSGSCEFTRQYTYLDLPFMGRFILNIEHGAPMRQAFFVGPCFSILRKAQETTAGTVTCSDGTIDTKDEMKPLDVGFIVGFAAEFEAGPGRFIFDVRYNQSFNTVDRTEDIKTSLLGINMGYIFSIFSRY
ncbi:MAG: PorT family protein [Chitinispirillaceae bacterium]|nr:PorT family protein [Chitinispirillaceae bacterium]